MWYSPDIFTFASICFSIVPLFITVTFVALVAVVIVSHYGQIFERPTCAVSQGPHALFNGLMLLS